MDPLLIAALAVWFVALTTVAALCRLAALGDAGKGGNGALDGRSGGARIARRRGEHAGHDAPLLKRVG